MLDSRPTRFDVELRRIRGVLRCPPAARDIKVDEGKTEIFRATPTVYTCGNAHDDICLQPVSTFKRYNLEADCVFRSVECRSPFLKLLTQRSLSVMAGCSLYRRPHVRRVARRMATRTRILEVITS